MRRFPSPSRCGFTLIELVVVVVILGIAAAIVLPRFFDRGSRTAELSTRSLSELVSAIGTRAALGGPRLALRYDARDNRVAPECWTTRGLPGDFSSPGQWADDLVLAPLVLDGIEVRSVTVDGYALTPSSWRIESRPGAPAPAVSIVVGQIGGGRTWSIDLAPGSLRAGVQTGSVAFHSSSVIDLDAQGLDKEPW